MSSAGARVTRAQAEDLMRKGVALAIEARDEFWAAYSREEAGKRKTEEAGGGTRQRPLVAASVGCYGAAQADGSEYRGAYGLTVEEVSREIFPALDVLFPVAPAHLVCVLLSPSAADGLAPSPPCNPG